MPKPNFNFKGSAKKILGGVAILGTQYFWRRFFPSNPEASENPNSMTELGPYMVESIGYSLIMQGGAEIATQGLLLFSMSGQNQTIQKNNTKEFRDKRTLVRSQKNLLSKKDDSENTALTTTANTQDQFSQKTLINYNTILRYLNISKSALALLATTFGLIRTIREIYEFPGRILSLSFPEGAQLRPSYLPDFLNMPILIPMNAALLLIGSYYNFRETLLSYENPYARPGDVPIFGLINSMGYISMSAEIQRQFAPRNIGNLDLVFPAGTSLEWQFQYINNLLESSRPGILFRSAGLYNRIAAFNFYKNLFQIMVNTSNYVKKPAAPIIEIEEIDVQPMPEPMARVSTPKFKASQGKSNKLIELSSSRESASALMPYYRTDVDYHAQNEPYKPASIKVKEKKRKQSDTTDSNSNAIVSATTSASAAASSTASDYTPSFTSLRDKKGKVELYNIPDNVRETALGLINEARTLKTIPAYRINSHLEKLKRFLPNGKNSGIDGSEFELSWQWNHKSYSIKYETPHASDHGQYTGTKLRKVLNMLEAGYLWGWEPDKIQAYLQTRITRGRLEPLYYIFGERPGL